MRCGGDRNAIDLVVRRLLLGLGALGVEDENGRCSLLSLGLEVDRRQVGILLGIEHVIGLDSVLELARVLGVEGDEALVDEAPIGLVVRRAAVAEEARLLQLALDVAQRLEELHALLVDARQHVA